MAAVDCESVWNLVFGRFPAELFNDQFLAHELLRFFRLNLESLQLRVPQYTHSFPNLLKVKTRQTYLHRSFRLLYPLDIPALTKRGVYMILSRLRSLCPCLQLLAWDSPALVDDFVDLLPSLVTTGTAVELLHTLLDLPCLSATLVLQLRWRSEQNFLKKKICKLPMRLI